MASSITHFTVIEPLLYTRICVRPGDSYREERDKPLLLRVDGGGEACGLTMDARLW